MMGVKNQIFTLRNSCTNTGVQQQITKRAQKWVMPPPAPKRVPILNFRD